MQTLPFAELELSPPLLQALVDMGFEEATPIQTSAIPLLLQGRDIVGQAQTGTGKTLAFGLPILHQVKPTMPAVQALILCPTRELALQVTDELLTAARHIPGLQPVPIYGGQPIERQFRLLSRQPAVVVGTPGRIIDHLERRTLDLSQVQYLVLDEADEMLNMGFQEDIEAILAYIPESRQTIFFSATMPAAILKLTKQYQRDPQVLSMLSATLTVPATEQFYLETRESNKVDVLTRLLDVHHIQLGLVFCARKTRVDELVGQLQARGYFADALHGDMRQGQRESVLNKFRSGTLDILVATDVAARGIDINDVEAVFNFDMPYDSENYVHRIGRTGRAGKTGKAFTLVTRKELSKIKIIEKHTRSKIHPISIPTFQDVQEKRISALFSQLSEDFSQPGVLAPYLQLIEEWMDNQDCTATEAAAALLKHTLKLKPEAYPDLTEKVATSGHRVTTPTDMTRLFITGGRKDRIRPGDLVGAIAGETGLSGRSIGEIEIHETFSFVDIPKADCAMVIAKLDGVSIRGRKVKVEVATPPGVEREPRSFSPQKKLKKLNDWQQRDKPGASAGPGAKPFQKQWDRDKKSTKPDMKTGYKAKKRRTP